MTRRLGLLLLLFAVFAMPSFVRADVIANVVIKWDTLDVRYLSMDGKALEFKWVDSTQYGEVFSEAETIDPYDNQVDGNSAHDFTTTMVANAVTANAQAYTVRTDTTLSTNAASHAGVGAPAPAYNFADSFIFQSAEFTLSGNGVAVVSFDWYLDVSGTAGDYDNFARASMWVDANYEDGPNYGGATTSLDLFSYDMGDDSLAGTFTFTVVSTSSGFATGEFYMDAWSYAETVNVPEPASCVLFGLGLGAMGFVGYRRRAAKN
jgi:hypothetical protein